MQGTMIWFNPAKRHGFIRTDDGERLRVDEGGLEVGQAIGERCRGTRVGFNRIGTGFDEPRAVNVTILPVETPRRARLRSRR